MNMKLFFSQYYSGMRSEELVKDITMMISNAGTLLSKPRPSMPPMPGLPPMLPMPGAPTNPVSIIVIDIMPE